MLFAFQGKCQKLFTYSSLFEAHILTSNEFFSRQIFMLAKCTCWIKIESSPFNGRLEILCIINNYEILISKFLCLPSYLYHNYDFTRQYFELPKETKRYMTYLYWLFIIRFIKLFRHFFSFPWNSRNKLIYLINKVFHRNAWNVVWIPPSRFVCDNKRYFVTLFLKCHK